ncbi:MAG: hypothetical protein D6739_01270 [Nitrospirae bacterium]|nr:MAG: hypothetical protein D6739_01270 [Nitrospirota bacterium]
MPFVQKLPKAMFVHVPKPGDRVIATIDGERLECEYRGEVQVLGKLPKDRRYKLYSDKLEKGFAWVEAKDVEPIEAEAKAA